MQVADFLRLYRLSPELQVLASRLREAAKPDPSGLRLHLRGSYIHVVKPEWGLSAQLRGRYFSNSEPREFDYYSPRRFAEILPVVQLRRFAGGWELVGAAGVGIQRDSESDWRPSRYAHARVRSPDRAGWSITGAVTYTNTPTLSGTSTSGYSYVQMNVGLSLGF